MDYICLGLASEELEYVDTSLRVIMSVHAGPELPDAADVGHRGSEAALSRAAGAGHEDRRLRPDRAWRRQRRARASRRRRSRRATATCSTARRRWISLADVADNFLVIAWTDLEKKKQRDPSGISAFIVERTLQGVLERADEGEVGHPRRQHRLVQDGRRRGAGGEPARPARRGLQDRDVRARSGALHRRRRRHRADSRLPRRERRSTRRSARPSASRSASTSS